MTMRASRSFILAAIVLLVGCAHGPKKPAHTVTSDEALDIARRAVADHGFETDAINQTRFYLQQDGAGWRVAAIFPRTPDREASHAIITISKYGKVKDYSTR
jgi:hypothetical protein